MNIDKRILAGSVMFLLGAALMGAVVWDPHQFPLSVLYIAIAFWATIAPIFLFIKIDTPITRDSLHQETIGKIKEVETTPPRVIPDAELKKKMNHAAQRQDRLPGHAAGDFQLLDEKVALAVTPRADPMTPMYLLDEHFRIVDWNLAFSLCFDRTLEGRIGRSVLEWTFFLDNYEQVLQHGIEKFGEGKAQPDFDIEDIYYTSHRYGKLKAVKRAYPIPDDEGHRVGWLITIKPSFESRENAAQYQTDLFESLRGQLMWSEYALSYDQVLNNSQIYPHLIQTLLGRITPGPAPIADGSAVLDLAAGTGNITHLLATPERRNRVVAVENNPVMMGILRQKCDLYLQADPRAPGVVAVKQDASSLFGLDNEYFDYAVDNNFLYCLNTDSVIQCLKEVFRVLKPGGELRISEPHRDAKVAKVMDGIKTDLQRSGHYERLASEYEKVRMINEYQLAPLLQKWSLQDMQDILTNAIGFHEITFASKDVYLGQSMLVCARKAA